MKISIVIPTRDRSAFLPYCIRTALACDDDALEVVVSNNHSQDDTRRALAEFSDSRLKVVHTEADLSMRQNFEFALSHTTGDYVIFIGDDDGVLPNGLASLRQLLADKQPDAVTWRHITYLWPHTHSEPRDGQLKFRCRDFFGPTYAIDIPAVLQDLCLAKRTNYRDGLNIYHGCIARRVIEQVQQTTGGDYFQGQCPDINTAFSNLIAARSAYWLRNPVTIAGAGERSTGSTMKKETARVTQDQQAMVKSFVDLAKTDNIQPEASCNIRSLLAHTYANLDRVVKTLADDHQVTIDHAAWRGAILNDLKSTPQEYRPWGMIQDLFKQIDASYETQNNPEPTLTDQPMPVPAPPSARSAKPKRKSKVDHVHLQDVATIVGWLQHVTGRPYRPSTRVPIALAQQALRSLGMLARVGSANKQAPDHLLAKTQ